MPTNKMVFKGFRQMLKSEFDNIITNNPSSLLGVLSFVRESSGDTLGNVFLGTRKYATSAYVCDAIAAQIPLGATYFDGTNTIVGTMAAGFYTMGNIYFVKDGASYKQYCTIRTESGGVYSYSWSCVSELNLTKKQSITPTSAITINPYICYDLGVVSQAVTITFNTSLRTVGSSCSFDFVILNNGSYDVTLNGGILDNLNNEFKCEVESVNILSFKDKI